MIFFHSGITNYLIVFPLQDTSQYKKSAKIKQMAKFKIKPRIVNLDWLINTMEYGQVQPADDYPMDSNWNFK